MRLILPLFLSTLFLLFSCQSSTPKNAPKDTIEVQKSANEEDLLFAMAGELIANPRTQAEKDKNTIINYMMDEGIELKSTESGLYYQMIADRKSVV